MTTTYRFFLFGLILLASNCLALSHVFANTEISKSNKIIAGFIMHFTSYVQWPNNPETEINICIIGENPFGLFLDQMIDARPTNRKGKKITLQQRVVGEDVSPCHVIYVTQQSVTDKFWASLPDAHSILLISEYENFGKEGGMVNFYNDNKRIRISINLSEVKTHKLYISSELLKIARITSNHDK